jgi:hypothetical protein
MGGLVKNGAVTMGGGGAGFGSRVRSVHLNGYGKAWMAKTKKTIEDELRFRGIAPETVDEIVSKIEEPSMVVPVLTTIVLTAFACTLIFIAIWESMP